MRNIAYVIIGVALACAMAMANPSAQQSRSAEVLLGQALHQEEVEGNLDAAIATYKKVLADYPSNRPLAAKALLQMGRCYEKLGKDGARKAYERLVRDYADQSEARVARSRLAALRKPEKATVAGMTVRKVWSEEWTDVLGEPSPDGRYLSFVDWHSGDLAVRDLQSGKNRRLTHKGSWKKSTEFALFSRWSPDGKQLVYDWYRGSQNVDEHVTESELRIIGLEGSKPRVLYTPPKGFGVDVSDWSTDGKHILATIGKAYPREEAIISISVASGSATVLKKMNPDWGYSFGLRFSPDGHYVLYDSRQGEGESKRDVFLLSTEDGSVTTLVKHPADDYALGWTPDGKRILFASDRTGSPAIWAIRVRDGRAQGESEMLRAGAGYPSPMGFTRDGSFFYSLLTGREDIYTAELNPKTGAILAPARKQIRSFEGHNSYPRYSRDGKYLAYLSGRGPRRGNWYSQSVLCVRSLDEGKTREFHTKFLKLFSPRWLPDGRAVIVAALDQQQKMSFSQIDLETGKTTPVVVADPGESFGYHDVSPDGKVLYYEKLDRTKSSRILKRSLDIGEEKELYAGPPNTQFNIALSPDGRQLAFISRPMKSGVNERVIRVVPATGGESVEMFHFKQWGSTSLPIAWSADGKYILFSREPGSSPDSSNAKWSLWRISASGGQAEQLALNAQRFFDFNVNRDGARIVFDAPSSDQAWDEVWVMQNFLPSTVASK